MKKEFLILTGANSKLGSIAAEYLLQSGYNLILHFRKNHDRLDRILKKEYANRTFTIQTDLTNTKEHSKFVKLIKKEKVTLKGIICNAAIFYPTPFNKITEEDFFHFYQLNTISHFFLIRSLLPFLPAEPSSSIVLFADIYGIKPIKDYLPYCVSKAGVIALTKALAKEIAPIRVNAIAPGAIEFTSHYSNQEKEEIIKNTLLKRKGTPLEIARTIKFLLENNYITGQVLAIDGGKLIL